VISLRVGARRLQGKRAVHMPCESLPMSLQDLSDGRTDQGFVVTSDGRAFLQNKRLKVLAVSSTRRRPLVPEVPKFEETASGPYRASLFFGLAAPAGTLEGARAQIAKAIANRLSDETFQREQLGIYGFDTVGSNPAEFGSALTGSGRRRGRG
jgi:tripartite-type tricarboxylate transporter receptor subunit TctC